LSSCWLWWRKLISSFNLLSVFKLNQVPFFILDHSSCQINYSTKIKVSPSVNSILSFTLFRCNTSSAHLVKINYALDTYSALRWRQREINTIYFTIRTQLIQYIIVTDILSISLWFRSNHLGSNVPLNVPQRSDFKWWYTMLLIYVYHVTNITCLIIV